MQTFDQHLMDLVQDDVVDYDVALAHASNPSDFELQLKTFRRRSRAATRAAPAEPEPAPNDAAPGRPEGFTDDLSSMLPS